MDDAKVYWEGIVILDLTRYWQGLACLADMGATVIKIENPKGGDDSRHMGPFINDNSVYYANFNRSKYGCTINFKAPEGKEMFKEMVNRPMWSLRTTGPAPWRETAWAMTMC